MAGKQIKSRRCADRKKAHSTSRGPRNRRASSRKKAAADHDDQPETRDYGTSETATEQASCDMLRQVEAALFEAAINGNITAAIFYLCNRAPERWRHIQKIAMEHKGQLDVPDTTGELIRAAQEGGFRDNGCFSGLMGGGN